MVSKQHIIYYMATCLYDATPCRPVIDCEMNDLE